MPKHTAEPPRSQGAAGPRHDETSRAARGDACPESGGAGTGGPRRGDDRRCRRAPTSSSICGWSRSPRACSSAAPSAARSPASAVAAWTRSAETFDVPVAGAVRLRGQHHGRDDRRGRGRPDAGRSDRPGAGAAGRGGADTADEPALPAGLPRVVPRVRGASGTSCRRTTRHEQVDPRWAALRQAATENTDRGVGTVAVPKRKMSRSNTRSPPGAVEGDRGARPWPARSASRRSCRTPPAAVCGTYNGRQVLEV